MKKFLIIFGGQDNEEAAARVVARQSGCGLATATVGGTKVSANTAYKADGFVVDEGGDDGTCPIIIFECAPAAAGAREVAARCDHHNPGDAGWGKGAAEYWEASSLGQLCVLLGVEPTPELRLVAAGDHHPVGAYLGQCPGVDPAEFLNHRIATTAAFRSGTPGAGESDPDKIRAAIVRAKALLESAPEAEGLPGVRNMRLHGVVDELPEAGLSGGFAYMAELPDTDREGKPTGNRKVVLGGHTSPDTVRAFMAWAETQPGLVGKPYGNPDRGFAGAIYTEVQIVVKTLGELLKYLGSFNPDLPIGVEGIPGGVSVKAYPNIVVVG